MGFNPIADWLKGRGEVKRAKETFKKQDKQLGDQFNADKNAEMNSEDSRTARMGFAGGQLSGLRSIPPEILQQLLKRKASTAVRGQAVDQSKGMMWNTAGNMANSAGNLAGMYMKGLGMKPNGAGTPQMGPSAATSFSAPGIDKFNPFLDRM